MSDNFNSTVTVPVRTVDPSLVSYTHIMYALHSLAVLIGVTSVITIVGGFVFGLPSIIAVIMNYVRQSESRGTFLESHFRGQMRTFWFALLWMIVIWGVSLPLMLILVGFALLPAGLGLLALWVIYRILRGWIALRDGRTVPV